MASLLPAYRLTIYKHRSLDATETTVLTPIAGAAHSDPFQVSTLRLLSGYKGYLDLPDGRRGRIDPVSKKTDVGEITIGVLDVRAGGITDNLTRWMSAFLGDTGDQHQLGGCKAILEECPGPVAGTGGAGSFTGSGWTTNSEVGRKVDCYNGHPDFGGSLVLSTTVTSNTATVLSFTGNATGATLAFVWTPFFTGRIASIKLRGKLWYDVRIRDASETLKGDIFVGKPHPNANYAQLFSLLPVGFIKAYGQIPLTAPLAGTMDNLDATTNISHITLTTAMGSRLDNRVTSNLWSAVDGFILGAVPLGNANNPKRFSNTARLHLKRLDTQAEGDFHVGAIETSEQDLAGAIVEGARVKALGVFIQPMRYPIGVATGTPLVDNVAGYAIGARSIASDGWTISITGILKQGDIVSFANHGTRYFITADVNSNVSGQTTFIISPGLTTAIVNNEAITVQSSPGKMALPPNGTSVEFSIGRDARLREENPNALLINDIHPVTVWRNILDGEFGQIYSDDDVAGGILLPAGKNLGDPKRPIAYNAAAFTALINDETFPLFRLPLNQFQAANEFIEEVICKPYGLGYHLNGAGEVVPVDLRFPSSLAGIVTLTDSDLETASPLQWEFDDTAAITSAAGTRYAENFVLAEAFGDPIVQRVTGPNATFVDVPFPSIRFPSVGQPLSREFVYENSRGNLFDDQPYEVDAVGLRAQPNETINLLTPSFFMDREVWADGVLEQLMRIPQRPFGRGPATIRVKCLRTANVANTFPGTLHLLTFTALPDPTINLRGGTRLVRCLERSERGIGIDFTFLDLGISGVAMAPTLGAPAQATGFINIGAQIPVTLNASNQSAEIGIAVTETTEATKPPDTSASWVTVATIFQSMTVRALNLPQGRRVWWRARTFDLLGALQPSAYVYPTPQFIDLAGFTAPSAMAVSLITNTTAHLTWTNGNATLSSVLYLVTPITDPLQKIAVLAPGTTAWDLTGLTANTQYKVEVRHVHFGGMTTGTNANFTTTNSPSTCPAGGRTTILLG